MRVFVNFQSDFLVEGDKEYPYILSKKCLEFVTNLDGGQPNLDNIHQIFFGNQTIPIKQKFDGGGLVTSA